MAKCSWCKEDSPDTWGGLCGKCWDADEIRESEEARDWLEDRR